MILDCLFFCVVSFCMSFDCCVKKPWHVSCHITSDYTVYQIIEILNDSNQTPFTLLWHHNGRDGISNHQHHDCLINRISRRRSKKTSNLRVTGLCEGNSPVSGEFAHKRSVIRSFDAVIMTYCGPSFENLQVPQRFSRKPYYNIWPLMLPCVIFKLYTKGYTQR